MTSTTTIELHDDTHVDLLDTARPVLEDSLPEFTPMHW